MPGDICDIAGDVIEGAGDNPGIVRKRQKRDARTNAGAENADAVVAGIRKPSNGGAGVEDTLSND